MNDRIFFSKEDTRVIKGIAIILMLYHHLFAFPERLGDDIVYNSIFNIMISENTISYWIGVFGKFCRALFIFLAGYGLYISEKHANDTTKYIINKLKNIYLIYWKVFFVFIPVSMLLNVPNVEKNIEMFLFNFLGIYISYNGEWWFFTTYVITLLIFPCIKAFFGRKNSDFFSDILWIFIINAMVLYIIPVIMEYHLFSQLKDSILWYNMQKFIELLPSFLTGIVAAKYDILSQIKKKYTGNLVYVFISIMALGIVFCMRVMLGGSYDFIYVLIFTCASVLVFQTKYTSIIYRILSLIGNESTVIWLTHSFYCYTLCPEIVYAPRYSVLIVIWLIFLCYITSKIINIFYKYLWKFFGRVEGMMLIK